ncbi:hypothetical protein COOONC_23650 [Cooperia oncophora]
MRRASIPVAAPQSSEHGVRYALDHVHFTPTQDGVGVPNSSTSALFFVDPVSGEVSANPQLSEQPQGVYSVVVNAVDAKSSEPLERIVKKFHYVKDDMKLRYVFSMKLEEFAASREQFSKKLQEALKVDHPEGKMQVVFSEPKRDMRNGTRTSVCFHVVMNEQVQNERSAISGPVTNNRGKQRTLTALSHFQRGQHRALRSDLVAIGPPVELPASNAGSAADCWCGPPYCCPRRPSHLHLLCAAL